MYWRVEPRLHLVWIALVLAGMSCSVLGGSEPTTDVPQPGDKTSAVTPEPAASQVACQNVSLAQDSGEPGVLLALNGLPPGIAPESAFASTDPSGDGPRIPIIESEQGPALLIPFHSNGPGGGPITLTVWVGSERCNEVSLEVESIEGTEGAYVEYVEALQELLDVTRTLYGVTREQLLEPEGEPLPLYLLPLAISQHLIDGPDVENNLRAIADASAPVSQSDGFDISQLDAMVTQLGLIEAVQAEVDANRQLLNSPATGRVGHAAAPVRQAAIGNIRNASDLETAMRRQNECESQGEGATGELLHDATVSVRWIVSGATSLMPGPWKYASKAAIFAARLPILTCEYLLPSSFAAMTADGSILWFPDEWGGGPGAVIQSTVVGVSKQLDLQREINDFTADLDDQNKRIIRNMGDDLCAQFESCSQGKPVLGPIEYGPVDVTGPEWTEAEAINNVVSVGQAGGVFTYDPENKGTGGVHLQTRSDVFGEASPAQTDLEVRVADCVDTGVNPPEATYQFSQPDFPLTCTTPKGTGVVTSHGGSYAAQLSWADAYACQISVSVGPVQYLAARTLATETVSVYQGVVIEGDTTCGVTMSWDEGSQGFLGELRCWAGAGGSFCQGTSDFSMDP